MAERGLLQEIKELNERANNLNKLRERKLAEKELAYKALQEEIQAYNAKYGTEISVEDVPTEYDKVLTSVRSEADVLKAELEAVERGEGYESEAEMESKVQAKLGKTIFKSNMQSDGGAEVVTSGGAEVDTGWGEEQPEMSEQSAKPDKYNPFAREQPSVYTPSAEPPKEKSASKYTDDFFAKLLNNKA